MALLSIILKCPVQQGQTPSGFCAAITTACFLNPFYLEKLKTFMIAEKLPWALALTPRSHRHAFCLRNLTTVCTAPRRTHCTWYVETGLFCIASWSQGAPFSQHISDFPSFVRQSNISLFDYIFIPSAMMDTRVDSFSGKEGWLNMDVQISVWDSAFNHFGNRLQNIQGHMVS